MGRGSDTVSLGNGESLIGGLTYLLESLNSLSSNSAVVLYTVLFVVFEQFSHKTIL
jgi:hypothetical protein